MAVQGLVRPGLPGRRGGGAPRDALAVVLAVVIVVVLVASPVASSELRSVKPACNATVEISGAQDVGSPLAVAGVSGRPLTCWYRFRNFRSAPKDWVLRIRFRRFKVGSLVNGTTCLGGHLQITDGNRNSTEITNRKSLGMFCGEIEQAQTFISETNFVKLQFQVDNFTEQTYWAFDSKAHQPFEVYQRYGQHPELYPNRRGIATPGTYCERAFVDCRLQTCYVQSPAFPGVTPRGLHCSYRLNTTLPHIKLYLENEEFNVDGQRCENIMTCPMRPISSGAENCPHDYLRVFDGRDQRAPLVGVFCGMGRFPYSIIGTGNSLLVEFVTSPAGPLLHSGFHFNVGSWPGRNQTAAARLPGACSWRLSQQALRKAGDQEGVFLSVVHWYPPHTTCTYLIQGDPGHVVRLSFPSFRINRIESPMEPWEGDCGESLTLYDASWPDDTRIIRTFCDTFSRPQEKTDFVSSAESMFVRFESKTGSYSGSSLYYWAQYDFFNNSLSGDRVASTACDELIPSWRASRGTVRSPTNTLVFRGVGPGGVASVSQDAVRCTYRFVTDPRLYARVEVTVHRIRFRVGGQRLLAARQQLLGGPGGPAAAVGAPGRPGQRRALRTGPGHPARQPVPGRAVHAPECGQRQHPAGVARARAAAADEPALAGRGAVLPAGGAAVRGALPLRARPAVRPRVVGRLGRGPAHVPPPGGPRRGAAAARHRLPLGAQRALEEGPVAALREAVLHDALVLRGAAAGAAHGHPRRRALVQQLRRRRGAAQAAHPAHGPARGPRRRDADGVLAQRRRLQPPLDGAAEGLGSTGPAAGRGSARRRDPCRRPAAERRLRLHVPGHGGHVHPVPAGLQRGAQLPPARARRGRQCGLRLGHVRRGPRPLRAGARRGLPVVDAVRGRRVGRAAGPGRPGAAVQGVLLLRQAARHRRALLGALLGARRSPAPQRPCCCRERRLPKGRTVSVVAASRVKTPRPQCILAGSY